MQKNIICTWQRSKMCHLKRSTSLTLLLILVRFAASEDDYQVSMGECLNAGNFTVVVNICCQPMDMNDEAANTCFQMKRTYPEDKIEKLKKVASVVGCIYRKRKYIKSDNHLNMGAVKAQAKKLYPDNSPKQDLLINMYRYCGRTATALIKQLNSNPKGQQFLQETRQPFFLFVFMCGIDYSKSKCPYFCWEGKDELSSKKCANYVSQCKNFFNDQVLNIKGLKGT